MQKNEGGCKQKAPARFLALCGQKVIEPGLAFVCKLFDIG
jgi:hypothetical protein